MSTVISASEASSLLKPDPPLENEHSSEQENNQIQECIVGERDDDAVDKSDLLNFEHDDEDDDDELESLRMAALQSRKPKKKSDPPAYSFKQHPDRNNLTQIVLGGPPPQSIPTQVPNPAHVALPDTSRPPPGYTSLSLPPVAGHGSSYGVLPLPSIPPPLTLQPPHPIHIPPIYPPAPQQPQLVHHAQSYHPTEYYDTRGKIYSRESELRHPSSYQYRDRSPIPRDIRDRRSPYDRDRYGDKYYNRGASPLYSHKKSPIREKGAIPIHHGVKGRSPIVRKDKFSRHDSHSGEDESDNDPTLSGLESEEEVEEEVEVTATESEGELEDVNNKEDKEKSKNVEEALPLSNVNDLESNENKENQSIEADDILNVDCTEEIDEFTNFLDEFEDELKDKPAKEENKTKITITSCSHGENKENKSGETDAAKKKKTKIVKRIVKRQKKRIRIDANCSFNTTGASHLTVESSAGSIANETSWDRRHTPPVRSLLSPKRSPQYDRRRSVTPDRDNGYSANRRRYRSRSPHMDGYKRQRQRTPTLSPDPKNRKYGLDSRHDGRGYRQNRSPYNKAEAETNDSVDNSKSKSLPPSKAFESGRRSNSRGALSQSRDLGQNKNPSNHRKETPEEQEEREFQERLKRAETQEDRDRMLARRQKFMNKSQPIEHVKKVISLKSKVDFSADDEPLNEKRLRTKSKEALEKRENEVKNDESPASIKANVTDLRVQLYKKRQQNRQRELIPEERDAREKLSKSSARLEKNSLASIVVRRTVDTRAALRRDEPSEDDSLDPLEQATVEDVSPRPTRDNPNMMEDSLSPKGKSRLVVKDLASSLAGRKVEAFVTDDDNGSMNNESLHEYSDEEQYDINHRNYGNRKTGLRTSLLDRLGEPVHNFKKSAECDEHRFQEYRSGSSNEFNNGSDNDDSSKTSKLNKKPKREKRDKKEKKEKKKLKELKKLEKKLKKLKAKKLLKKSGQFDSDASETEEDDYDDRIEYFMSDGDQEEQESTLNQQKKEKKKEKLKKDKSSPKNTGNKKRSISGDSTRTKKEDRKEDDSDDELFAFFEKGDGKIPSSTSSAKRSETTKKTHVKSIATPLTGIGGGTSKRIKESGKPPKTVKPGDDGSLMSKMKKKNEKTMKRLREIEEDKLVHR